MGKHKDETESEVYFHLFWSLDQRSGNLLSLKCQTYYTFFNVLDTLSATEFELLNYVRKDRTEVTEGYWQ